MKVIFSGLESSGKSLQLARSAREVIYRNAEWFKITGVVRPIYSNMHFRSHVEEEAKRLNVEIRYYTELEDLLNVQEADIFMDEVGNYFDKDRWADVPRRAVRWLNQGAKKGVHIYGGAQDFAQVAKQFRRLTTNLVHITKVMGSRRPSKSTPPVKRIWGVCSKRELDPQGYKEDNDKFASSGLLPSFFFITREDCELFDTNEEIDDSQLPELKHVERRCSKQGCTYCKIQHV